MAGRVHPRWRTQLHRRYRFATDGQRCATASLSSHSALAAGECRGTVSPQGASSMRITFLPVLVLGLLAASDEDQPAASPIPFHTHDGYFVSNKFEPAAPASFVVIQDQKA